MINESLGEIVSSDSQVRNFQRAVIVWYRRQGRLLYWRNHNLNDWQWLVLEILLRKTRAEAVEKVFPSLIKKYFEPSALLRVSDNELENDLRVLGLYRQRREILKQVAERITNEYNNSLPSNEKSLISLPGIGPYIANAVLCFCHGKRRAVVDINVARILTRFLGMKSPVDANRKWIWKLAEKMLPMENWKEYNYGLLDLGAIYCTSRNPHCLICCLKNSCAVGKEVA